MSTQRQKNSSCERKQQPTHQQQNFELRVKLLILDRINMQNEIANLNRPSTINSPKVNSNIINCTSNNFQLTVMNIKKVALSIAFTISTLASTAKISFAQQFEDASSLKPSLKTYVMTGIDANSNPYSGDTNTSETHSLLCIVPSNLPTPAKLPPPRTSPGGALVGSFSRSYVFAVPNVQGTQLTSKAAADKICKTFRQNDLVDNGINYSNARMAEFHDGDKAAGLTGWKFWGVASENNLNGFKDRLWVSITDQNANPWGTYKQQGDGQPRKALTFSLLQQLELP